MKRNDEISKLNSKLLKANFAEINSIKHPSSPTQEYEFKNGKSGAPVIKHI